GRDARATQASANATRTRASAPHQQLQMQTPTTASAPHKQLQTNADEGVRATPASAIATRARRPCHTSKCKCNCAGWDLLFASYVSRKNQMQIPRFGLAASLGMTKQVGESRSEDCWLRERSFRSGEWPISGVAFHRRTPQRCAAAPSL